MAVIIEDMEMPTRCTDCDFATVEKDGKAVWRKCGRTGDTCTMHAGHFDRMETCPLRPENEWIPVSERLPEEETDVLVTVHFIEHKSVHSNGYVDKLPESFYVDIANLISDNWNSYSDEYKICISNHHVIAWKPLPEPYKARVKK